MIHSHPSAPSAPIYEDPVPIQNYARPPTVVQCPTCGTMLGLPENKGIVTCGVCSNTIRLQAPDAQVPIAPVVPIVPASENMGFVEEVKTENVGSLNQQVQVYRNAELTVKFTAPLGMVLEGNRISSVSPGGLAYKMGVKARAWHIAAVNGVKVPKGEDITSRMIQSSLAASGEVVVTFSTSLRMVTFPQGPLGMTLEGNRVVSTTTGGMAERAGVKPGFLVVYVGSEKVSEQPAKRIHTTWAQDTS
uniref:PDZ domain-containing protein n=1 Tax=Lotharella globosa TaxID=91324 RepID=A0A6V3K0P2_9EUKA|mmetsp:Transcript_31041/g.59934  ORF Transcript_31041/g.59934 Transcript_31041/m.59934 type:complete len:247 (+) Transcript_31041:58-798(+)